MVNRVRLVHAWASNFKTYAVGTVLQVDNELFERLISEKYGEVYKGPYPPKGKVKMNLEQLKF